MSNVARSMAIRALARLGQPRLHALRSWATASGLGRAATRGLESGTVTVPAGPAQGIRFRLRRLPLDHAHFGAIVNGRLEIAVQEAMIRHLPPGGVLFDVGANLGFFSLLGARLAGPSGHVYAFEPVPENAEALAEHAALNQIGNVTVIERAVGARSGPARLQLVADRSWSKLAAYGEHPQTERVIEVEAVAIDDLLAGGRLPPPAVVKIDVEGAELEVLEGMGQAIAAHRPAIICELHGTQTEFAAAMDAQDYRVINLKGTTPVDRDPAAQHALALPRADPGD